MSAEETAGHPEQRPALRIVRGETTPEELAALVAVLAAASGGAASTGSPVPVSQWAPPPRLLRPTVAPTGWWESALPR